MMSAQTSLSPCPRRENEQDSCLAGEFRMSDDPEASLLTLPDPEVSWPPKFLLSIRSLCAAVRPSMQERLLTE